MGKKIKIKLSAEVAEKYDISGAPSGHFIDPTFGEIDLTELSLKKADRLVKKGFKYLVPKKGKK
jgi:hypothetical protein